MKKMKLSGKPPEGTATTHYNYDVEFEDGIGVNRKILEAACMTDVAKYMEDKGYHLLCIKIREP